MSVTAQQIIDQLQEDSGEGDGRLRLNNARPSDWTLAEIERMSIAAGSNSMTKVEKLNLKPEDFSHISVAPVVELFRNTSTLKDVRIESAFYSMNQGRRRGRAEQRAQMIVNMLFCGAIRNRDFPARILSVNAFGNPELFQRFIASSKLEELTIHRFHDPPIVLSPEIARALATGLSSLDSLNKFSCLNVAVRRTDDERIA